MHAQDFSSQIHSFYSTIILSKLKMHGIYDTLDLSVLKFYFHKTLCLVWHAAEAVQPAKQIPKTRFSLTGMIEFIKSWYVCVKCRHALTASIHTIHSAIPRRNDRNLFKLNNSNSGISCNLKQLFIQKRPKKPMRKTKHARAMLILCFFPSKCCRTFSVSSSNYCENEALMYCHRKWQNSTVQQSKEN